MRENGCPLQPVLGTVRSAIITFSAASADCSSYALIQKAHLKGAISVRMTQSMRVQSPGDDPFDESFWAIRNCPFEFHFQIWYLDAGLEAETGFSVAFVSYWSDPN